MSDYYETLGVSKEATQEEIRKAYKHLAVEYHPDRNPDDPEATTKFKAVAEAYDHLSDPQKRAAYDRRSQMAGFGGFPNIFEGMFRRWEEFSARPEPMIRKGQSIRTSVEISLKEVLTGTQKEIKYKTRDICSTCKGNRSESWDACATCNGVGFITSQSASMMIRSQCHVCGGSGKIPQTLCEPCSGTGFQDSEVKTIVVDIPQGAASGMQIRLNGMGGTGVTVSGDLFVNINVKSDENFVRENCNLFTRVQATYTQLVLGGEAEINSLDGKLKVKIPPRTHPGMNLRIKGQGLPLMENPSLVGDLFAQVELFIPTKLSAKEHKLLKQLSKLELKNE